MVTTPSLVDQLRQSGGPQPKQPSLVSQLQGQQTQLQQAARATQAGAGGLGFTGAGRGSRQTERFSLAEVAGQEQQIQQAEQMQAAQVDQAARQQEQQFQFQAEDQDERALNSRIEWSNQARQIVTQFSRESTRMELAETKAAVEFSATLMRLSTDAYVEQLQMEGRKSRLDSEVSFKEALAEAVFDDEIGLLTDDLNFRSIINADRRTQTEWVASFDLDYAIRMAESSAQTQQAVQKYQAVGEGISAVAGVVGQAAASGVFSGDSKAPATGPTDTTYTGTGVQQSHGVKVGR